MGAHYVCDYCGELIEHDRAVLHAIGWERFGDYHVNPCLGFVREAIEAACGRRAASPPPRREDAWREDRESWKKTPKPMRDRLVLEALGDQRLTSKEMRECLREKLGHTEVYTSDSNQCLMRLLDSGDVLRVEIPGYRGGPNPRWRYYRNAKLNGPIEDLERTFHEQGEGA